MPMYTTKNRKGEVVSLSDHEALNAEFLIERRPHFHRKNSVASQLTEKSSTDSKNLDRKAKSRSNVPKSSSKQKQKEQPDSDFIRYNRPRIISAKHLEATSRRDLQPKNNAEFFYAGQSERTQRTWWKQQQKQKVQRT